MIESGLFLAKLREKSPDSSLVDHRQLRRFIDELTTGAVYPVGAAEPSFPDFIGHEERKILACYFVAVHPLGNQPRRMSMPISFSGPLMAPELALMQSFIEECRAGFSSASRIDPDVVLIPCPARAMVVLSSHRHKKRDCHEHSLLIHRALQPILGVELIYRSLMHWRDTFPADPTFYVEQQYQ